MSRRESKTTKIFLLPLLIAAILFISIAKLPYIFYTFMRIVVPFLSCLYLLFIFILKEGLSVMHIPNILITVLWNPFLPVYHDKETWIIIDIVFGVLQLGMAFYTYYLEKKL